VNFLLAEENTTIFLERLNIMKLNKAQITQHWPEICRKIPIICGLKTLNAELTVYATLQQTYKQFDWVQKIKEKS